jgi:hypothetical protein
LGVFGAGSQARRLWIGEVLVNLGGRFMAARQDQEPLTRDVGIDAGQEHELDEMAEEGDEELPPLTDEELDKLI